MNRLGSRFEKEREEEEEEESSRVETAVYTSSYIIMISFKPSKSRIKIKYMYT